MASLLLLHHNPLRLSPCSSSCCCPWCSPRSGSSSSPCSCPFSCPCSKALRPLLGRNLHQAKVVSANVHCT